MVGDVPSRCGSGVVLFRLLQATEPERRQTVKKTVAFRVETGRKNDRFKKFEDLREAGTLTLIERLRAVIRSR